jgi:hypothetical protein
MRSRLSRAAALGVAVAVGLGAGAAVAAGTGALKGSSAAVHVAQHVLTHVRHVAALRWQQTGDQWECPAGGADSGGPVLGPAVRAPARDCRKATATIDENLRNGLILRSQSTITARGLPTETDLVTAAGKWMRLGRMPCWESEGAGVRNDPAFSYTGERLSIAARTPSIISLNGVASGYRETDAIDARTFAVRHIDERVPGFGGTADLVDSFAQLTRPFALPQKPRHVCSDIVRFPPQGHDAVQ